MPDILQVYTRDMPWGLVTALISTTVMLLVNNYYYGLQNQLEHLPIIMRLMDKSYLVNDFFVNSASVFGPRYYYAHFLSLVGKAISLPVAFLVFTFLINVSIDYVTYLVALLIGKHKLKATMATVVVTATTGLSIGAAGQLRQFSLEPSLIALSISLWGIYLLLYKRINWATLVFAFASFFHPSVALLTAMTAFIAYLIREKNGFLQLVVYLAVFLLIWIIPSKNILTTNDLFQILVYFRNPHHLIPSTFPLTSYLFLGIFVTALYVTYQKVQTKPLVTRYLAVCFILAIASLVAGYIFIEILPLRPMIPLQTWRMIAIISWVGILIMTQLGSWWSSVVVLVATIANKGDLLSIFMIGLLLLSIHKFRYKGIMTFIFVILVMTTAAIDRIKPLPYFSYFRPIITTNDTNTSEDLIEDYVRVYTTKEAVVLTPASMGRMRIRGMRAIVVDFKAVPYQEQALREWYLRLNDVYGPSHKGGYEALSEFNNNYLRITDEKLMEVNQKYLATYAVLFRETPTKMPLLYENDEYKLVAITY